MSYSLVSPCRPLVDVLSLDCLTPDVATAAPELAVMGGQLMNKGVKGHILAVLRCVGAGGGPGPGRVISLEMTFVEGACKITQRCRQRRSHAAGFWAPPVLPESALALVRD